jgi:hypothetical protein
MELIYDLIEFVKQFRIAILYDKDYYSIQIIKLYNWLILIYLVTNNRFYEYFIFDQRILLMIFII